MKKLYIFILFLFSISRIYAQSIPQPWIPVGADTSYPRSIIHTDEISGVKTALAAGTNIDLYTEIYNNAISTPPTGNDVLDDKRNRAYIAKNSAFCFLLGVKPSGNTTAPLSISEKDYLRITSRTLLEQINTYVNVLSSDSPNNFDNWQWTSKQIIDFVSAYDLLRGAGVSEAELALAKNAVKIFTGNLYFEATKTNLGTSFFQGAKNNHSLMTAGAIGMAAVILSDLKDTLDQNKPYNWINAAMWNIHNVLWWDIKRQSTIGQYAGYAEGTYYYKYAFCNLLPFFRAIGFYLKDTSLNYQFNDVNRKIRNPWYDTNYVKIYDWFEGIRMPDGRMPAIEDSYTYRCFPELAILRKSKYVWPLSISQLDPVQYNTFSLQLQSVYDLRANFIAANTSINLFKDSLFKVMPEAGIAVFRSSWDSTATYFALTGKHGNALASADAHNHADDGSFLMMVNGQTMALDPGYLSYEFRDTVASATSHNMLLINGAGPLQGRPGKSNGANCYIEKTFSSDVQDYAELRTNYLNTDINRKVMFVRKKYFLMIDHLSNNSPQQYSYLLHGYGLEGGDLTNTGIFTDLFSNNRAAWKRRNSGLYAIVNSDANITFNKKTGVHEYIYQNIQNHTYMDVKTVPINTASYLTCLQPFKDISTDTFPVITLNIPTTSAYKINDGTYLDIAVSKSSNSLISIPKSITGLSNDYSSDAHFFWASEQSGSIVDLFMQKGRVLKKDLDTLISCSYPINMQYIKTGPKTYKGFCGDTGWIDFHTGEYPIMFTSNAVWFVKYNVTTKIASVYFADAAYFNIVLDDTKIGMNELNSGKSYISVYPNPASDLLNISFDEMMNEGTKILFQDITGKIVFETTLEYNSKHLTINVSNLSNGLYIARLTDTLKRTSSPVKIIISK